MSGETGAAALRVIATAGHVDHGKSSLIRRLTGIDPDRLAEETRRGLTIELGYAWTTLPSGREVAFVDVPGHERFVRTMLAGVGPVPVVLFVVAADEGWKPQSEEHLEIVDVLGVAAGVIALTKLDLVDGETLAIAEDEVREKVGGTALERAAIVPVSSQTGDGLTQLMAALDAALATAPVPPTARTRLFVDRAFTIRGSGTVVTGTLTGGCLEVGQDVAIEPSGRRARIRALQSHERGVASACAVARVAANLAGVERGDVDRGDVLAERGTWRPTATFEASIAPVRGLSHPLTGRGAFSVHAGASESPARVRLYGGPMPVGAAGYARVTLDRPLLLDVFDRFVVREAGRRETVAGGVVLDVAPPRRAGPAPRDRLAARASASRNELPALVVAERGAITRAEARTITGSEAPGGEIAGDWFVAPAVAEAVKDAILRLLEAHHAEHPLDEGAPLDDVRRAALGALARVGAPRDPGLADASLDHLVVRGDAVRSATTVRLSGHRVDLGEHGADVERLLAALTGADEPLPPDVKTLVERGFAREVIDAAARGGVVVRLTPDIVVAPSLVERAASIVRQHAETGVTVSSVRETLGTSRKYAVPLLEHLDRTGVTRREGDLRFPRS
ncbi:MAG TPA: selenocysteine-specific translation elongation factor [Actinomycetota bacterium]|nr:selenocysteine-specific translation elongation factor [Actinomycetota bacterium]